jgi:hypothetical protein
MPFFTATELSGPSPKDQPKDPSKNFTSVSKNGVRLTIAAPKRAVAGELLVLGVTMKNESTDSVFYLTSSGIDFLGFEIVDPKDNKVPKTRYGMRALGHLPGSYVTGEIKAGQERALSIPISRLFDLSTVDTYTVTVRCALEDKRDNAIELIAKGIILNLEEP